MSKPELSPIDQAYQEVPQRWYELSHKGHIAVMFGSITSLHYANREYLHIDSLQAHLVAASLFVISALADRYSTVKALQANAATEESGLGTLGEEKNVLLSDIKEPREFMRSKKALAIDLFGTATSLIDPGVGAGLAIGKTHAAANNFRAAKRQRRAAEIQNSLD